MNRDPHDTRAALIVGTGGIADSHAEAYHSPTVQGRAVIAGAVDVDRARVEAFSRRHAIPCSFTDFGEALEATRPDLVHLCTPPSLHAEQSIQAMEAGAWVLCEKPPCASLAELDRIQAAERATGRHCATLFQWRFGSGMQHLKERIEAGVLGKPLVVVCNTLWYRDEQYFAVPWRGRWATEIGGTTVGHGIHLMDSLLWLMGDWVEVTARMGTLDRAIEVEDVSMAIVRFANGAMASMINSVLCPRQETYLRIDFQHATVETTGLYSVSNRDWRWTRQPAETGGSRDAVEPEKPASHTTVVAAVLDDMDCGRAPLTNGTETRRTVEFLTAMYKSAQTGEPVRSDSIGPSDPFYHALIVSPAALGNPQRSGGNRQPVSGR